MSEAQPPPIDLIDLNAPWAGEQERALRRRIYRAGTVAQARAMRERNGRARLTYWLAAEISGAWTFRRVTDNASLERILRALNQYFMAADSVQQEEGPDDASA